MIPDKARCKRILDNSGDRGAVFDLDSKTVPESSVSHVVPLYIAQAGMEIAGREHGPPYPFP